MNITISHSDFKTQLLEISIPGYFYAPRLLVNGSAVRRINGVYTVLNDGGHEVAIRLNSNLFYRLPQLLIEQDEIKIMCKAGWIQFAGWKNTPPVQWFNSTLKLSAMFRSVKKLNKSS
jgi:hypothetical protein